jgi:hypothetical protein
VRWKDAPTQKRNMKSAVRNRENRIIESDSSQLGRSFQKTSFLQRFLENGWKKPLASLGPSLKRGVNETRFLGHHFKSAPSQTWASNPA